MRNRIGHNATKPRQQTCEKVSWAIWVDKSLIEHASHVMWKNRTAVKLPVFVPPPLTTVNLIIDRINNRWRGQSRVLRAGRRDETRRRRRRAGFANKKKRRRRARGSPTASNSIPVVRERAINRVETEEKGRLASRARLLCIALLLTQEKKKGRGEGEDEKEWWKKKGYESEVESTRGLIPRR